VLSGLLRFKTPESTPHKNPKKSFNSPVRQEGIVFGGLKLLQNENLRGKARAFPRGLGDEKSLI
jgi:hypothetical protein